MVGCLPQTESCMKDRIIQAITLALLITASLNLGLQVHRMHLAEEARQRVYEETGGAVMACYFGRAMDEASRFFIELALIVAFAGSRLKHLAGRFLYVAGLIGAILFYIRWWEYYFQLAEITESKLELRNVLYLHGANYWDICIAASIALLLLWEISRLFTLPFRSKSHSAP